MWLNFKYLLEPIRNVIKDTISILIERVCPSCPELIEKVTIKTVEINKNYNIINNFWWFLTNETIIKLYSRFTLMETMLLVDGLINASYFIKEYLILAVSSKKLSKIVLVKYNNEIVDNYNNVYILNTINRYLFYLIIYFGYNSINYFVYENQYSYLLILLITIPSIQNRILLINYKFLPIKKHVNFYVENQKIFIKYSISKLSVEFIGTLHPQIDKIQNYHIFIIYRTLDINFILNIFKNILFIGLLNFLRSMESTYWYYKGIKAAYYHNVGYMYNVLPLDNALFIANKIIKEKRWKHFDNIEIINAFFVLITNKYDLLDTVSISFFTFIQINCFKLFSLWSLVSLLKMINFMQLISGIWICIFLITIYAYLSKFNAKNIITSLIVYFLIIFNINDLIITLVIISNKLVYYWIAEIYFFSCNIKNVRKVIKSYEQDIKKNILDTANKEYELI
jgi:hypothetical protein